MCILPLVPEAYGHTHTHIHGGPQGALGRHVWDGQLMACGHDEPLSYPVQMGSCNVHARQSGTACPFSSARESSEAQGACGAFWEVYESPYYLLGLAHAGRLQDPPTSPDDLTCVLLPPNLNRDI